MFESFKPIDRLVLKKFSDYWEKGLPLVDSVVFKFVSDETSRLNALQSGDVDIVLGLPIEQLSKPASSDYTLVKGDTSGGFLLILNTSSGIFKNVKARQAVMQSVDRNEINQFV